MSESKQTKLMRRVRDQVVDCQHCSLHQNRTYPVVGQGGHTADLMFVGEAPGAQEDKTGIPFCGRAGSVLDMLLQSIDVKREDVYICNILKCRPPNNRDPLPDEIAACTPFLKKQISVIKPKVIGTLGNYAAAFLMRQYGLEDRIQGISRLRGQVFDIEDGFKLVPLYHPAVAVYNQNMQDTLKKDFQVLKQIIDGGEIVF